MGVLFLPLSVWQNACLEKEEEAAIEADWQTTPDPDKTHTPFQVDVGHSCDLCGQSFTSTLELLKHEQFHEENSENVPTKEAEVGEPTQIQEVSFPCNMCDQSFATNHILKRHKLLHVRDGRKCPLCGVLFCRRHNHVAFLPQQKGVNKSEPEDSVESKEPRSLDSSESDDPQQTEEHKEPDRPLEPDEDGALCILTEARRQGLPMMFAIPAFTTPAHSLDIKKLVPPLSHSKPLEELSRLEELPVLPVRRVQSPPSKHLKLPPNSEIFSTQRLTSVFLEVQRNYKYIINKAKALNTPKKKEKKPCEKDVVPQCPQLAQPQLTHGNVPVKSERVAYDMEIVL